MPDINMMRTMAGMAGLNTLVLANVPVRFQIAPGNAASLGVANVDYELKFDGDPSAFQTGQTDADGEILVPLIALVFGTVVLTIFDTEYGLSMHPDLGSIDDLAGQQKRLDVLGYMTGQLLVPIGSDTPDDGVDGPRTQQSFLNVQMDKSLTIDGEVGPQTKGAIKTALGES